MTENDPPPARSDILDHLSPSDALAVLRILVRDESLAPRIVQVATAHLERNAPHNQEDVEAIAEQVYGDLEQLEVEEVWDQAGPTRYGYVETYEVADEMIGRMLEAYSEEMACYQRLGMGQEAVYLCMGVLGGLYQFGHESESEFKDWATDLPLEHADLLLLKWRDGKPTPDQLKTMRAFIEEDLPHWGSSLLRSLGDRTVVRRR
jgi:hypothetical protein